MKEVYVDSDLTLVGLYKSILESAQIACYIRNENTRSLGVSVFGFSHTPLTDPVLCITDDDRYAEAIELIQAHRTAPTHHTMANGDWICPQCKESLPASFQSCWNCETARPDL